jgi:hypothetical protein
MISQALSYDLLLAGGLLDPDVQRLHAIALDRGLSVIDLRHGPDFEPEWVWDLQKQTLSVNGLHVRPRAAFARLNRFQPRGAFGTQARDEAWYTAALSYAQVNSHVAYLNRDRAAITSFDAPMLVAAKSVGLEIPETRISNSMIAYQSRPFDFVAQPMCGGSQVFCLSTILVEQPDHEWIKPSPAIIQTKQGNPLFRIFMVEDRLFAFDLSPDMTDKRRKPQAPIRHLDLSVVPQHLPPMLRKLARRLRIDFCAVDFKRQPDTGQWVFQTLTPDPMFAPFDDLCDHQISHAILDVLCDDPAIVRRDPISRLLQRNT